MKRLLIVSFTLISLFLANCDNTVSNENSNENSYSDPSWIAEAEWLNSHLDDSDLIILDARGDSALYNSGHIKGAILTSWMNFVDFASVTSTDSGFGEILPPQQISTLLSQLGIEKSKTVIVYGAGVTGSGDAGRIVWTLKMAGIENARLLNGDLTYWNSLNYGLSTEMVSPKETSFSVSSFNQSYNVSTDWVNENKGTVTILDTRSKEEYDGQDIGFGEKQFGHIPGAVHSPYQNLYAEDGRILSQQKLDEYFSGLGIENKSEIIVPYCAAGIRSAITMVVLRLAGYSNAKNYDASYYGWAAEDLPVE